MFTGLLVGVVLTAVYQCYREVVAEVNAGWPMKVGFQMMLSSKPFSYMLIALTGLIGSAIS